VTISFYNEAMKLFLKGCCRGALNAFRQPGEKKTLNISAKPNNEQETQNYSH